jgi:hypothetical protein
MTDFEVLKFCIHYYRCQILLFLYSLEYITFIKWERFLFSQNSEFFLGLPDLTRVLLGFCLSLLADSCVRFGCFLAFAVGLL